MVSRCTYYGSERLADAKEKYFGACLQRSPPASPLSPVIRFWACLAANKTNIALPKTNATYNSPQISPNLLVITAITTTTTFFFYFSSWYYWFYITYCTLHRLLTFRDIDLEPLQHNSLVFAFYFPFIHKIICCFHIVKVHTSSLTWWARRNDLAPFSPRIAEATMSVQWASIKLFYEPPRIVTCARRSAFSCFYWLHPPSILQFSVCHARAFF